MSADPMPSGSGPAVSVIVPSFRRPDRLTSLLDALADQDLPRDRFEVVVVDDGSPEPLAPAAEPFRDRIDVRVHRQDNAGPATARNVGARLAGAPLLAFTDDDCRPAPGWLARLLAAHERTPTAMLGGHVVNAVEGDLAAEASQLLVSFLYEWYDDDHERRFFASNNLAVPAEGFHAIDGFDTSFPRPGGEDRELCERWHRHGRPLREVPDAVVHHHHAMGLRGLVKQHLNYGRGAYDVHRRRADHDGEPLRVEPLRFYLQLLRYPLRHARFPRSLVLVALTAVTQVANVAGFALELREQRRARRS